MLRLRLRPGLGLNLKPNLKDDVGSVDAGWTRAFRGEKGRRRKWFNDASLLLMMPVLVLSQSK